MTIEKYVEAKPLFEKKELNTKTITDLEQKIAVKQAELLSLETQLQIVKDDNTAIDIDIGKI